MLSFEGRTAIVTGAGRGMGRTHALLLAERGANVVVNDLGGAMDGTGSDAGPAEEVAQEIVQMGGRAVANTGSVATPAGATSIVATALESFGGVDIVINNAGVLTTHRFPDTGAEDLDLNLSVHLLGSYNVTRAAWPELVRSGAGRVVFTTSCALFGSPELVAYGAAKGGLLGLARNLAVLGAEHGVKVNLVSPYAKTRMADPDLDVNQGARADVEDAPAAAEDDVFARLHPELVSPVVAFFAHESCPVTGEVYAAGGGRVARIFLAETEGIADARLTPETLSERWREVQDETGYYVPPDITLYTTHFMERVPPAASGATSA
ncbi:MAG: SDR family NAD(P)-dependent oxidoreductase [Solirubrobacteraceae bacterium]